MLLFRKSIFTWGRPMDIEFTTHIFKEGRTFVAHAEELDISSCGGIKERALKNLKEAVRLFLEEPREWELWKPS